RGERRREVARDPLAQAEEMRGRAPDLHRRPLVPERCEEAETLGVVEVERRQADVHVPGPPSLQVEAERPDPGAGIEDQRHAFTERDLDAGGVAAVGDRVGPRCRHGAAAAPDGDAHAAYSRQKIATMPTNSSACANSGKAVTATLRSVPSLLVMRNASCAGRLSSSAIRIGRRSGGSGSAFGVRGSNDPVQSSTGISPASAKERPTTSSAASL